MRTYSPHIRHVALLLVSLVCLPLSWTNLAVGETTATLVYFPATGQVILDGECAAGGVITNFVLQSDGQFINTDDVVNPYGSVFFTSNSDEISASDGSAVGLALINLGDVLPAGLTLAGLEAALDRATYVGELGSGEFDFDLTIGVPEAKVVVSEGELQRSMVLDLEVSFTGDVQIGSGAFSMVQRGGSNVPVSFTTSTSNGSTIATLSFSGANTENSGSLVDGNYELTIDGSNIVDSLGNDFDVDRDGNPGGTFVFGDEETDYLYRLFGDFNRSRSVNIFDLLGFRQTYLLVTGDASFNESFDSNLDGAINIFDLLRFRQNYLKTLAF